jgi:TPR repeat protein
VRAKVALGVMLLHGDEEAGIEPQPTRAVALFRAASDARSIRATVLLARCLERGDGVERADRPAARKLYEDATRRGSSHAALHLGCMVEEDAGAQLTGCAAPRFLPVAKAPDLADPDARSALIRAAELYETAIRLAESRRSGRHGFPGGGAGGGGDAHAPGAADALPGAPPGAPPAAPPAAPTGAADTHVAEARFRVARIILDGRAGLRHGEVAAIELLEASAAARYAPAMVELGVMLLDPGSPAAAAHHAAHAHAHGALLRAEQLFHDASTLGNVDGTYNLALMHESAGRFREAAAGYELAAAHGSAAAMVNLGVALLRDHEQRGIEFAAHDAAAQRILRRAAELITRASDAGDPDGSAALAILLDTGRCGLDADHDRAVALYARAAAAGNPGAMFNLAMCLESGADERAEAAAREHRIISAFRGADDAVRALLLAAARAGDAHAVAALGLRCQRVMAIDDAAILYTLSRTDDAMERLAELPFDSQRAARLVADRGGAAVMARVP